MDFRIYMGNFLLFLAIGNAVAFPQAQPVSTDADTKAGEMKLYAGAHPYLDEPDAALRRIVPDLRGLEPASSQDQLSVVLAGVGANVTKLLRDLPDLTSNETVGEDVSYQDPNMFLPGHHPVQTVRTPGSEVVAPTLGVKTFNYIVLVHETDSGRMLEEYRTDRKGRPVAQGPSAPNGTGFVSMWVVFGPANRRESRFHYLGQQLIGGHNTFVVAFAQIPGEEAYPGSISLPGGGTIPMLSQGVAWIDESDFRILRLRTDLLAPQPQVGLNRLTAMTQFSSVHIETLDAQLWLPREVKINLETDGHVVQELHQYSHYRLYKANARIVTGAP